MNPPDADLPLSVERLATTDLTAAGQAVATILTAGHVRHTTGLQAPFVITVSWNKDQSGERWDIALSDVTVALDRDALAAEAERLLQPVLQFMRPRALRHVFRSRMDEATFEDLNIIGNAGVMPSADAYEPRWVEDRTVLHVIGRNPPDVEALESARRLLAGIDTASRSINADVAELAERSSKLEARRVLLSA